MKAPEVQQYVMSRTSLRTGRRTPYMYDTAIPAPDFSASQSAGSVSLAWGIVMDEYFRIYEVERSSNADFSTSRVVFTSSDNHDLQYIDAPGSGDWYYRLKVINSNDLKSYSGVASVSVP